MNEDADRAKAERGRRFAEWCNGPDGLFAVFTAVERNYAETLFTADITDAVLREKVCHRVAALRDIKLVMQEAITAGKSSEATIRALAIDEEKKRARGPKTRA
jgi:hypothetical protein